MTGNKRNELAWRQVNIYEQQQQLSQKEKKWEIWFLFLLRTGKLNGKLYASFGNWCHINGKFAFPSDEIELHRTGIAASLKWKAKIILEINLLCIVCMSLSLYFFHSVSRLW